MEQTVRGNDTGREEGETEGERKTGKGEERSKERGGGWRKGCDERRREERESRMIKVDRGYRECAG